MNYTDNNHETLHDGRNIIDGRRRLLVTALDIINWAVPVVLERPATQAAVETSVPFVTEYPVIESPASKEAVANSAPFAITKPQTESQEAADAMKEARARADELAVSAQEGLENVSKANQ